MNTRRGIKIKLKRTSAVLLAVCLTATCSLAQAPLTTYAVETTGGEEEPESSSSALPGSESEDGGVQSISAVLGGIKKYFTTLKLGASPKSIVSITPGLSLAETTTSLTFPADDGLYYLVTDHNAAVTQPTTHAEALNSGWMKKAGTGNYVWLSLDWNHSYDVYQTDLTALTLLGTGIVTNKGKTGGAITIDETALLTGQTVEAVISDPTTTDGTWSWSVSHAPGGPWTPVEGTNGPSVSLTDEMGGNYLKTVFTASDGGDYTGGLEYISTRPIASKLTRVSIQGTPAIGETLSAEAEPASCDPGIQYSWYRQIEDAGQGVSDILLFTGKTYVTQAADIGKKLYVKAVSLPNSVSDGDLTSDSVGPVRSRQATTPESPILVRATDVTMVVKAPAGAQGLYQFAYSTEASPADIEAAAYSVKARGEQEVTIPNLTPSTLYYVWIRECGENGWTDSEWSVQPCQIITAPPALTGSLVLSGNCVYGETLTVSLSDPGQAGSFQWYRIKGTVEELLSGANTSEWKLQESDIGCRMKVIYTGNGTSTSGKIQIQSDLIEKKEQPAPVNTLKTVDITTTDATLSFTLPSEVENACRVGYAGEMAGAPDRFGGVYNPGDTVTITGLERNKDYYLFLKYVETSTQKESVWSGASEVCRTEKSTLESCTITFDLASPNPGNMLTAQLNNCPGEVEGDWSWVEITPGGDRSVINFVRDITAPEKTSVRIPDTKAVGTVYEVSFTGSGGLDGIVTNQSEAVTAKVVRPYDPPAAPVEVSVSDQKIEVSMPAGTEGIYEFCYSDSADTPEEGRTLVAQRVYGSNSVIISTGIIRNRDYYVWAKQIAVENSGYSDSGWSSGSLHVVTTKTEIAGFVEIQGEAYNGETLTAAYTSAQYMPAGDDTGGSWQWHKALNAVGFYINGEKADPVYQPVAGQTGATYTLTKSDVNYTLKAVYSGGGDFEGSREAETAAVKKTYQAPPKTAVMVKGSLLADKIQTDLSGLTAGVYYQIRLITDPIPTAPDMAEDAAGLGWRMASDVNIAGNTGYYQVTSNAWCDIQPNTDYIIYTAYAGTEDLQPSTVTVGNTLNSGGYGQEGTITYTSLKDTSGVYPVSGELIRAELTGGANHTGTWKWYVSKAQYTDYAGAEPGADDWELQISGFYPINDSSTSDLTLTEAMVGKYIRAEFEADIRSGYEGTVDGGKYGSYVRKIYKETLTLESSTSDGNGNPSAYQNTVITGTVQDYAESGALSPNRTMIELLADGTRMEGLTFTYSENTFSCKLPRNSDWGGKTITARVGKPADLSLYLVETPAAGGGTELKLLEDGAPLVSGSGIPYKDGIAISTAEDLRKLINCEGGYSSRTEKYVITNDIKCDTKISSIPQQTFTGALDGDYHTVTNLESPLFWKIGTSTVVNIIFNKANIDTSADISSNGSGAVIAQTMEGNAVIQRVFLSQADVYSGWDSGYFVGKTLSGKLTISESGSAGGSLKEKPGSKSIGGMVGYAYAPFEANNVFSYKTRLIANNDNTGGLVVAEGATSLKNVVVASVVSGNYKSISGGVAALYQNRVTISNAYFDSTLSPAATLQSSANKGTPRPTEQLIGNGLKDVFNSNLWVFTEGYYPRLAWMKDHPVSNLFAATRGAFISVDTDESGNPKTSSTQMFNGEIHGTLEVPEDLQGDGYSYTSSNSSVLEVTESGRIIPVGTGKAKVQIHYEDTDPDRGCVADNDFEFTVGASDIQHSFTSVTISGTPQIGQTLTATVVPAITGVSYQWYRRQSKTVEKSVIPGAVSPSYEVEGDDAGFALCVEVKADGYGAMTSVFTDVVEVLAPSSPPAVTVNGYQSVTVSGRGGTMGAYEFAYAVSQTGEKHLVDMDPGNPLSQTITGLEANTTYWFFSRIPAGIGYSASPWSAGATATTERIPLEGELTLNENHNVGTEIMARMPNTNMQTGTWKVERVGSSGTVDLTAQASVSSYEAVYTLLGDDVGSAIRFTFTGSGKFKDSRTVVSVTVDKSKPVAPALPPVKQSVTDTSITLGIYSGDPENTIYEYGCQGPGDAEIKLVNTVLTGGGGGIQISGLNRNTQYSIYVRLKETSGFVTSGWSPPLIVTTDRTDISGYHLTFQPTGLTVEDTLTVTAPVGDIPDLTGKWSLERVLGSQSATLFGFTVSEDESQVTYVAQSQDAGYQIRAAFTGTGNYKGTIRESMGTSVEKKQYPKPDTAAVSITDTLDSSVYVQVNGVAGTYQFGYQKAGTTGITACEGSVQQGSRFIIDGLMRNSDYQIYVRRQAEPGYIESGWSEGKAVKTARSEINGDIRITGNLWINATLTAEYNAGYYVPDGDDTHGTLTWKVGERTVSGSSCALTEADGGKTVTVTYVPPEGSDFTGTIEKLAGVVVKASVAIPAAPMVTAVTDTAFGSTLRVTNGETGVWYQAVKAADSAPPLVKEVDGPDYGWIKAVNSVLDFGSLTPDMEYVVYAARLETDTQTASPLAVSGRVKTLKEELSGEITWTNGKPMSGTKVTLPSYREGPTGVWYWYTSKDQTEWKLFRTAEAGKEGVNAVDSCDISYDYSGYYVKIVFQANGSFTGEKVFQPPAPLELRQISGTVTFSNTEPRLFDTITASYGGTDEKSGTWIWYREQGSGWTEIASDLYGTVGVESTYITGEADKGKKLKAVYTAASFGSTGSAEGETTAGTALAKQNRPAAPKLVQIRGTWVWMADSAPNIPKPYGERPELLFGCRKAGTEDAIAWNVAGDSLFENLEPNTAYAFYLCYEETAVYGRSEVSEPAEGTTQDGVFSADYLELTYDEADGADARLDVGKTVTASYSGQGYEYGTWTISRSSGEVLQSQMSGTIGEDKNTCTYEIVLADVNASLLFTFQAQDNSGYTGSVEKKTYGTVRKIRPASPEKPKVVQHEDTDFYLDGVVGTQEYAVTEGDPTPPGRNSGAWEILDESLLEGRRYRYTGLKRGTVYYVHTRVAETGQADVSDVVTSDPVETLPYFGLGTHSLVNEQELGNQPKVETVMDMPETLELNGSLTLESVTLKPESAGGYEPLQVLEPYGSFVTGDGRVSPNVYESGSRWANDHYGTVLEVLDSGGQIIGSNHENPKELTWTGQAAKLRISLYRANAVTEGGTYIWEFFLKDQTENTVLFHGEITIITQLKATVPLQIGLQIMDQEIRQTTNGAGLKNSNGMPVEVSVDEKPIAGEGMPPLLGEPVESDPQRMDPGAVYLKLSVDGSIETGRVTDLWLNTRLASASIRPLVKLGALSQADYYISGLISENGTVSWPWPDDGSQTIQKAYQLKFIYEISADGYPVYTPKISSPDSITVLQEGGES